MPKIQLHTITIARRFLRRALDPDQLVALANDLQRNGQIQPIAVRDLGDGTYALIAGRRRLEAAKLLGWPTIEAHIMDAGPSDEIRGAAENIKRVQLSPLEEADIVRDLHLVDGMSIRDIVEHTGHGTSWVQDRLALVGLPQQFQDAVHTRALSISAALIFQTITDIEYRDYLLHCAKTNGATIHQVQAWVADWTNRTALNRSYETGNGVPQPPPLPPPQPQPCFFCKGGTDPTEAILVRACLPCFATLKDMMAVPSPASGEASA